MENPRRTLEYDVRSEPHSIPLLKKVNLLFFPGLIESVQLIGSFSEIIAVPIPDVITVLFFRIWVMSALILLKTEIRANNGEQSGPSWFFSFYASFNP
jgi:hypothetical protein